MTSLAHQQACAWVQANYELNEDGVVQKEMMYRRYEEYCLHIDRDVIETSNFGRAVKAVFQNVAIRRLGGRDNLKYHYCGIQAQATSPYVSDNDITTKPKRKRRKRNFVTDPREEQNCVQWLQSNYLPQLEGKVALCDIYLRYRSSRMEWEGEILPEEQLGELIMRCFSGITKKKIGKLPQQPTLLFIGLGSRHPLEHGSIQSNEQFICMLGSLNNSNNVDNNSFHFTNTVLEDEKDICQSPESEAGSDLSAGTENSNFMDINSDSMGGYSTSFSYHMDPAEVKNEPVDYSLPSFMRTRNDTENEVMDVVKQEVSSPPFLYNGFEGNQHMLGSPTPSPSPPPKPVKNRIYKPKFHGLSHHDWSSDVSSDVKMEPENLSNSHSRSLNSSDVCRQWLRDCLGKTDDKCVYRSEVYEYYCKYCEQTNTKSVEWDDFDQIVQETFPETDIVTYGEDEPALFSGLSVIQNSDIDGRVHEVSINCEPQDLSRSWEPHSYSPVCDNSPTDRSSSPITIEDDDEDETEPYMIQNYRESIEDDIQSIPEILRDGKYYLKRWLTDNFESVGESCILKADAHYHYVEYAKSINQTPLEMNVFGKMVRDVFHNISARRLGGRNNPKYHYCGIAAKKDSYLSKFLSGKDPAQRSRKKEIATDNPTSEFAINWLNRHYEACPDRIIPKTNVIREYNSYCKKMGETPVSINYFGKLVKHCFPSVDIRKFGGRTDPNWCYQGLSPSDPQMMDQAISLQDVTASSKSQYFKAASQSPQHYSISNPSLHHSNPIAVPGGGLNISSGIGSNPGSPYYNSPQLLVNPNSQFLHSQLLRQQHEFQQQQQQHQILGLPSSPSSLQQQYVLASSPDQYPRSPGLSRAFREDLHTHTPVDETRMGIPSPYEPEHPQDPLYSRSPEVATPQSLTSSMDLSHLRLSSSAGSYNQGSLPTNGSLVFANKRMAAGSNPAAPQCHTAFSHKRVKHHGLPSHYPTQFSGRS